MTTKENQMNRYTIAIVSSISAVLALGFTFGVSGCGKSAAATTQSAAMSAIFRPR